MIDADLEHLRERLHAGGWPATPNGHGLYARCPVCNQQTVLIVGIGAGGSPTLETQCATGCLICDTEGKLQDLADPRRTEQWPAPAWCRDPDLRSMIEALRVKAEETDVGNVERFCLDWRDDLRHVAGFGGFVYDGRRWRHDDDGAWMRRAVASARLTVKDAKPLREHADELAADADTGEARTEAKAAAKKADRRVGWAMTSQSAPRLKACLEIARTDSRLIARADDLDADPWALCVGTGIVDLRSGELRPHTRAELHTRLVPIAYQPDADCPRFEDFLATVLQGDRELIDWMQKAIGYSISGNTREQVAFILHGDGANGKSTLLNVLVAMLGEHAITADSSTFTTAGRDRAARSDIARCARRRIVVGSEIPRGAHLDEDLFKRITGGERIAARFNRQDEIEFTPEFKIWLGVNHLPVIHGSDHAIWRRLRIVPFKHRVAQPDLELGRRLHTELPGILAWAIRGCTRWQAEGLGTCSAIEQATDAYRHEQDQVERFIDERCKRDSNARTLNSEIYDAYTAWATTNGAPILSKQALGTALTRLGFATGHSNGQTLKKGLAL